MGKVKKEFVNVPADSNSVAVNFCSDGTVLKTGWQKI